MNRSIIALAVASLLFFAMPGSAQNPADNMPAFKHPRAVQAWKRLQFRQQKAQEAYEREMAAARTEYQTGLKEAAQAVARTGNVEELKAIADGQAAGESPINMVGQWRTLNNDGGSMLVQFHANGSAAASNPSSGWSSWKIDSSGVEINGDPPRFVRATDPVFVRYYKDGSRLPHPVPCSPVTVIVEPEPLVDCRIDRQ